MFYGKYYLLLCIHNKRIYIYESARLRAIIELNKMENLLKK